MTNQLRPNQLLRQIHYDIFKYVSGRACPILSYRVGEKTSGICTVNDEISARGTYLKNKLLLGALIRQGRLI